MLCVSVDINECAEFSDNCHQLCNNNNGSFSCSCRPGFELNPDNVTCNGNYKVYNNLLATEQLYYSYK